MWTLGYNDVVFHSLAGHRSNLCSQYYHLMSVLNEQSNRDEFDGPPAVVVSSSRWNPTPEQFRILEELYRRGTRTPSADQIQRITEQLRRYGKIEGKNVFYWFQNHKARERQKRRRLTADSAAGDRPPDIKSSENNHSESATEPTKKNWALPKNCSTTISEEHVKTKRMAKVGSASPGADEEEQLQKKGRDCNVEWHEMSQLGNRRRKTRVLNSFVAPYREGGDASEGDRLSVLANDEDGREDFHTLQLFPLRSGKSCKYSSDEKEAKTSVSKATFPSFQFFEFLPLRTG